MQVYMLVKAEPPCYCCFDTVLGLYDSMDKAVDDGPLSGEDWFIITIELNEFKKGGW